MPEIWCPIAGNFCFAGAVDGELKETTRIDAAVAETPRWGGCVGGAEGFFRKRDAVVAGLGILGLMVLICLCVIFFIFF